MARLEEGLAQEEYHPTQDSPKRGPEGSIPRMRQRPGTGMWSKLRGYVTIPSELALDRARP